MDLKRYIEHPEQMDRDSLYELRKYVALYPYHQLARILMLRNLYLLHDASFDDELRQAAFYITERKLLFDMVEGRHYVIKKEKVQKNEPTEDRTMDLISDFLNSVPQEEEKQKKTQRKPTPADATVDYVAYLLETDNEKEPEEESTTATSTLIDNFLENGGGKIVLSDNSDYEPHIDVQLENDKDELEESYFTETLAKIYIKQGNYSKALEIIRRLNLIYPKKSVYFVDQMRFLEKIILIKQ